MNELSATDRAVVEHVTKGQGPQKLDALGRPLLLPKLPRKSSNTPLSEGFQWNGRDVPGTGSAAQRRVAQMQARGLRYCVFCEQWVPIATTRIVAEKVACFTCLPEGSEDPNA